MAVNAWSYFEPGVGIDVNTGLPYADGLGFTDFTDWDLGCYIQATIDAQKLGIMDNGTLSFNNRISTVLTFLNYRDLNSYGYPYQFYDATTGNFDTSESNSESVDVVDTGRLFVALNNLIEYNSSFQKPVDEILARSNYTALVPGIESEASSNSIYSYYVASGFASGGK